MEEQKRREKQLTQSALIGLIGAALTLCCGIAGAVASSAATIYKAEQDLQEIQVAQPSGEQTLTIHTDQVTIEYEEALSLNETEYAVYPDLGFVIAQPYPGWNPIEEMTYADLFQDTGALSPLILFYARVGNEWDEQPLFRIQYPEPVQVQYLETTTENGVQVDLERLRQLTGDDTEAYYSGITVLSIGKEQSAGYTLPGIALAWAAFHQGGVNRLVADEENRYIVAQVSWKLGQVQVDGRLTDLTIERWALFAEGPQRYYIVEVDYVPGSGQSIETWETLQAYMASFRVIR